MPFIGPGFAQANVPYTHTGLGRKAEVTLGLDVSDAGGDYGTLADNVHFALNDFHTAHLDTEVVVGPVTLLVGQDTGPPVSFDGSTSDSGGVTAASQPANCALLVKKVTAAGGRKNRGRWYFPWCLADSEVDELGFIDVTVRNAIAGLFDDAFDLMATQTPPVVPVILHATSVPDPTPLTAFVVETQIATQRRRLARL